MAIVVVMDHAQQVDPGARIDDGCAERQRSTAPLNSPLTKSSLADSVLSSWHGGNQRWRWGGWTRFRMI